ncbi:MAG: gamma-glutamyltransferase [Candidatus Aminicenantaceae bacterium]
MRIKNLMILPRHGLQVLLLALCFMLTIFCGTQDLDLEKPPLDRHEPYNFRGKSGMVVAAHPLAAEAGLEMLKKGGNAVDAAIATTFALNAAEPFASGIGGGGFMVIYSARDKKITAINFREKAPSKSFPEMYIENGETNEQLRRTHGLAVAVPGALAGWSYALDKYGTKALSDVMQKAIQIAEEGFPVSKTFSKINKDEYEKLLQMAGESCCYLNEGLPFEPDDVFRNPELANTFRLLASKGIEAFYKGEIARKIVTAVQEKGGILTLDDLADYSPVEHTPIKGQYKDYTLYSARPPASGGLHIIQLLNIIDNWPVKEWGHNSVPYIHHLSEAFRFVFADRAQYLGDPDYIHIPESELTSKAYGKQIASQIKPDHVLNVYPYGNFDEKENEKESTTHLCVIDREGNIVALTQTINLFFGSGIIPENTGFLLNNEMDDFSRDPESPNAPRPHRRPLSSQAPLILFQGEEPLLVLGSPGGTRIFPTLTQIILNVIEFDMSLDEAIEASRFFSYSVRGETRPIALESRMAPVIIETLKELGHEVLIREDYDKYFGGAQGIMILPGKDIILGGADSRRDGYGAGY